MRKSTLLKVISIIFIIIGAIQAVSGINSFAFLVEIGVPATFMYFALVTLILFSGIYGLLSHNKPENAQKCVIIGIILLGLQVASLIMDIAMSTFDVYSITALVFPVLYLVASFQLKKI